MPVDFLTDEQASTYAQFATDPSETELAQFFYLDGVDWTLVAHRRGDHNRLGIALHLCTSRYLGTFLADVHDVPARAVAYVAHQLHITAIQTCLDRYQASQMRYDHVAELKVVCGYREFMDPGAVFPLVRLLYVRSWTSSPRPITLFEFVVDWLRQHRILLPGITTLTRLIARVRDRVASRLWQAVRQTLSDEQVANLEAVLRRAEQPLTKEDASDDTREESQEEGQDLAASRASPQSKRRRASGAKQPGQSSQSRRGGLGSLARRHRPNATMLEALRREERKTSAPALLRALDRLELARGVGVSDVDLSHVPASRLKTLSDYAVTSKLSSLVDLADDRRVATLLAFVRSREAAACDDALTILDHFMEDEVRRATSSHQRSRLRSLRDLDEAALTLADLDATVLAHLEHAGRRETEDDPAHETAYAQEHGRASETAYPHWSAEDLHTYLMDHRDSMLGAITRIWDLAWRPGETIQQELRSAYPALRRFLPRLLRTVDFTATSGVLPLTKARDFLMWLYEHPSKRNDDTVLNEAPVDFVPASWRKYVSPPGKPVDLTMYTLCFATQFHAALKAREVFAPKSTQWSDPRTKLLQGSEWDVMRPQVAHLLQRSLSAQEELAAWESDLDTAYRQLAGDLPQAVTIKNEADPHTGKTRDRLHVAGLEEQPDPVSLQRLRALIAHRLPVTDLSGVVMEMEARTHFAEEFTHIGGSPSRLGDFAQSLSASLMAQACNLPISAVAQEYPLALAADRLVHVQQNYIRPETIAQANARLVEYHRSIPLSALWGSGEVASADGLRFVVPVRTINAGPSSKYFGVERGVTLINYTMNHFFGFNGAIVTGTLRDSLYVLDGLLEQTSPSLQPQEIMTDTASYSDVVFGLFSLLGYVFSPRLADLEDLRFWRFDLAADYGPLNGVSHHRLQRGLIETHWDDILRVVGSLRLERLRPSELVRMLQHDGRPTSLGRALGEVGRIAKTFYLLHYVADETYRRRIQIQLNRGESRHSLSRAVFHGRRGELRQAYREGQEEQLGALGFVVNLIVVWNTLYQDRILADLRSRGWDVIREDLERLSPLGYDHIKLHGQYPFMLAEPVLQGGYLPLRDWEESDVTFP